MLAGIGKIRDPVVERPVATADPEVDVEIWVITRVSLEALLMRST